MILDYRDTLFVSAMDLYMHLVAFEMQRAWAQSERPSEICFLLRPVSRIYPPNQFDAVICQARPNSAPRTLIGRQCLSIDR